MNHDLAMSMMEREEHISDGLAMAERDARLRAIAPEPPALRPFFCIGCKATITTFVHQVDAWQTTPIHIDEHGNLNAGKPYTTTFDHTEIHCADCGERVACTPLERAIDELMRD